MLVKASRYGAGSVAFRYLQAVRFLHLGSRKRQAGGVSWYAPLVETGGQDRKSTRLNSSHGYISYAVFCLKKKKKKNQINIVDDRYYIRDESQDNWQTR